MATQTPTTYKVGDNVQLKAGGPEMTVKSIPNSSSSFYTCQWFAGKKLEQGQFPPDSLRIYVAPQVPTSTPASK